MASYIIGALVFVCTFGGLFGLMEETGRHAKEKKQSVFAVFWFASLVIVIAILAAFYYNLPDILGEFMGSKKGPEKAYYVKEFLTQLGWWNLGLYGLCVLAGIVWGIFDIARGLFRAALRTWFREVNAAKLEAGRKAPESGNI